MEELKLFTSELEVLHEALLQYIEYMFIDAESFVEYLSCIEDKESQLYKGSYEEFHFLVNKLRDSIPLYYHIKGDESVADKLAKKLENLEAGL